MNDVSLSPDSIPAIVSSPDDLRFLVACFVAREAGSIAKRKFDGRPGLSLLNFKGHQDYLSATDAEVESRQSGPVL